ncbi:MAG: sugar isomerase [Spirochaetales bacterium]|nr:sugar isomerase [Spirochaetales bacterium]
MTLEQEQYSRFFIVREMMETADVIRQFDVQRALDYAPTESRILLTGEGSSRLFPAKRAITAGMMAGYDQVLVTEGATQAAECRLDRYEVYAASNSGRTAEVVRLIRHCRDAAPSVRVTAVVANGASPVAEMADRAFVLDCGREQAVAATKSVVEQALFYHVILADANGGDAVDLASLSAAFREVLTTPIPAEIVRMAVAAPVIYFAGRTDGVAEELTLKTNEITRKKSDYLEGTYAVHGIEEVMEPNEILVLIDPFPDEEAKIAEVLTDGVGLSVISIAARETRFPTITIPHLAGLGPYLQLAAGWNLLVEIGIAASINLDKPARARKVGNEFSG